MLRREPNKLSFQGIEAAKDRDLLLRMAGLQYLDEATLLGALLETKAALKPAGAMEAVHNKGREALRILQQRKSAPDTSPDTSKST